MLIYLIIFILLVILSVEFELNTFRKKYWLWGIAILLALFAGFRGVEVSKDYYTYQRMFDFYNELRSEGLLLANFEPGFSLIIILFKSFFEVNYGLAIMLFFAIASVFLKVYSFNKIAFNPFLLILFYYSTYYFLHEMTQIRVGLAVSVFFMGLPLYLNGKKLYFFLCILLATAFHYSAILFLLIYLLDSKYLTRTVLGFMLLASVVLGFYKLPLLGLLGDIAIADLSPKLSHYTEVVEAGVASSINVFNSANLLTMVVCLFYIVFISEKQLINDRLLNLSLKFTVFSVFILSFLSGVPTLSYRVSELFGVMSILVFTSLHRYFPFGKLNILVTITVASLLFYITVFHGDLIMPYSVIQIK